MNPVSAVAPKPIVEVESMCTFCKGERRHIVLLQFDRDDYADGVSAATQWQIVECGGCRTVSFRRIQWCSEWLGDDGQPSEETDCYPLLDEREIIPFERIPDHVDAIYRETVTAFNRGLYFLCSAGMRAVIEGLCVERGVTGGPAKDHNTGKTQGKQNLEGKINGLFESKHLTKVITDALHNTRVLGNESLHELTMPPKAEMSLALDILEHALASLYHLDAKAEKAELMRRLRTRSPVGGEGVWNPATNKATLSWSRCPQLRFNGYEIRYCSGSTYDRSRELLVEAVGRNCVTFETDKGLTAPGSFALFRIYTTIAGTADKGSEVIRVERP